MQRGDEWHHWLADLDGNLMLTDEAGFYHRATEAELSQWQAEAEASQQRRAEVNARRVKRLEASRARQQRVAEGEGDDYTWGDSIPAASSEDSHFYFPTRGKVHGLVVLVEYQDVKFTIEDPLQVYSDMMNKEGFDYAASEKYVHHGSAHDYFYQNSMGQFDPQFDVYGPLTLLHERAYYGGNNDRYAYQMITEACEQLDSLGVDFNLYDNDHNGQIDFVFAFYAGEGENATRISNQVWPHAWDIQSAGGGNIFFDDLMLADYACTCELYKDRLDGVGTFCHEFSHVLGLPDLYDVNYNADAPYNYSVLDNGCYALSGYCPIGYSSYERYELGWLTPTLLPDTAATLTLTDLGTTNQAYIQPVTADDELTDWRDGEYYLFENRQLTSWDQYLKGHGMLVWHIDYVQNKWYNNTVNTWANHQCVDLVEASRIKYTQDGSEPFPGIDNRTEFTQETTPAFCGWSNPGTSSGSLTHSIGKPITNICEVPDSETGLDYIRFHLLGGDMHIDAVERDDAASPTGIALCNGRLTICHPTGRYDAMGRRL